MPNEPWQSPETQPTTEPTQSPDPASVQPVTPAVEPVPQPVAEAVATPTPAAPAPEGDNVWVSKEEYERLRQAEAAQSRVDTRYKGPVGGLLIAAVCLSAVFFVGSLMTSQLSFYTGIGLIALVVTGGFTLNDYTKAKREGFVRAHKARNTTLFVIMLVALSIPVLATLGFIILLMLMAGSNGGRGT